MIYGYHRVSTREQKLDRGINEIEKYCEELKIPLEKIYTDKISGRIFKRSNYNKLKNRLKAGDILIITELDRLGRDKAAITVELQCLKKKSVQLRILEIPTTLINLSIFGNSVAELAVEMINNLLIEVFSAMAQTELEKREKRQRDGIEAMKARGEWHLYGRPRKIDKKKFKYVLQKVKENQISPKEVQKQFGISQATYYRYRQEILNKQHDE